MNIYQLKIGIRKDLKKSYKFFQNLKPSKRRSLQAQSEDAISTMGITFQLYKGVLSIDHG